MTISEQEGTSGHTFKRLCQVSRGVNSYAYTVCSLCDGKYNIKSFKLLTEALAYYNNVSIN